LQALLETKQKHSAINTKLIDAKKRRQAQQFMKDENKLYENRKRELIMRNIKHRKWLDDYLLKHESEKLRIKNDDQILMRKLYTNLVQSMHEWDVEEENMVRVSKYLSQ
jgi:hypothetical protein